MPFRPGTWYLHLDLCLQLGHCRHTCLNHMQYDNCELNESHIIIHTVALVLVLVMVLVVVVVVVVVLLLGVLVEVLGVLLVTW